MHWGKGIFWFLVLFIISMLGLASYIMLQPSDDFDPDYYEKGIHFDRDFSREKRVFADKAEPKISIQKNQISLVFTSRARGKIQFIRPSSHALDRTLAFTLPGPDTLKIGDQFLDRGNWQIILEWNSPKGDYLYHKEVYLP